MDTSTAALWRLVGEGLALTFHAAPGYEARLTASAALVLSGESAENFNYAVIDQGPKAEKRLHEFVKISHDRKLPLVVALTEPVANELSSVARELELHYTGQMPLMRYTPQSDSVGTKSHEIIRIDTADRLKDAVEIMTRAFGLSSESAERVYGAALLEVPGVNLFLVERSGHAVGTVMTTRSGDNVGIWAMATHPDYQRQGAGRALMSHIIAYHHEYGAQAFYLLATEAGRPLYEQNGFIQVSEAAIWAM